MSLDLGLWKIGEDENFERLSASALDSEERLERFLLEDPDVLGEPLLVIDRQVTTIGQKRLDVLAIDGEGNLHVVELKRGLSPREVTAQVLDYASWVRQLGYEDVKQLYENCDRNDDSFEAGFDQKFRPDHNDTPRGPEEVNAQHQLTVVASELDDATQRIIEYLSETFDVPINALRFNYYRDGDSEYIARTWLTDPYSATEGEETETASSDQWNGHVFYANYKTDGSRTWSDAREYGFISGGGGEWYSRTMGKASVGSRLFVYHPGNGYIGVGTVRQEKTPVTEFTLDDGTPILDADLDGDLSRNADDPELREYLIGVDWIETRDIGDAEWETGMYAQQNTVTKLRDRQTLEWLYETFDVAPPESD
jgi:hypothetical protein